MQIHSAFICFISLVFSFTLSAQKKDVVYEVDGLKVESVFYEELNTLNESLVDHVNVIKEKSELDKHAYEDAEALIQIFTKAYMNRADSLKQIPSTKQMERKQGKWHLKNRPETYSGAFRDYYLNGNLKGKGQFKEGKLEGKRWLFFDDGSVSEELNYENGFPEGKEIKYFPNGTVKQIGYYREGYEVGEWKKFHPNGELKQVSNFSKNGKLNGEVKSYYSTGELKGSSQFVNGELVEDAKTKKLTNTYEKGKQQFQLGKFKEAIELFNKCITSKPNWNDAYFARGTAYLNNNEFKKALNDFDKSIEIEPLDAYAYTNRAFVVIRQQEFKDAKAISTSKDVQIFGVKKVKLTDDEQVQICKDLETAKQLGDENRMLIDAMTKYCQ